MYSLSRISLVNWYLIDAKDIDIRGEAALIGPTGAGKSSIQDAIQTVITGANQNRLALNASASGRSSRSVLEYCLGMTSDPSEDGRPLRSSCETILALTFRNAQTDEPITVGVAMAARLGDSREDVLSRFIVPGHAFSVADLKRRVGGVSTIAPWSEIAASLRRSSPEMEEFKSSAEKFTARMLAAMRGPGRAPNPRHFLRAFSNALAFKPIFDPTVFVRDFVLEPDPLDVERVRSSIATWREFERLIRDAETRHNQGARTAELARLWAGEHVEMRRQTWRAGAFEARRCAHEWQALRKLLVAKSTELATEQHVLQTRRDWIKGWDEEIRSKRALLVAATGEAQLQRIDAEAGLAERDLRDTERAWIAISGALRELARLAETYPAIRHPAAEAAGRAAAAIPAGGSLGEVFRGGAGELQSLVDAAKDTGGWQAGFDSETDTLSDEIRRLQAEIERAQVAAHRPQGGTLSREADKLLAVLKHEGIPAFPLCDVVDVADPSWQYAAEALLGRGREAIIVQPTLLKRAFDVMWSDRNTFSGCTLVKTSATGSTASRLPPGSIVEALSTHDAHAQAFLSVRIGAFRKAETEAELDRLDRGVMRNGKTSSGMGLTVQRDLRELLFGRRHDTDATERKQRENEALQRALLDARTRMSAIRNAGRSLASHAAVLSAQPGPIELEHRATDARRRHEFLQRERVQAANSDSGDLRAELADIQAERDAYAAELSEEVEPKIQTLQGEIATARAKGEVARDKLREALKARRVAWEALQTEEYRGLAALDRESRPVSMGEFRTELRRMEEDEAQARALLSTARNEARSAAETGREQARRRQVAALRDYTDYVSRWRVEAPSVEIDGMAAAALWIEAEVARLETNELMGYRESCARAGEEMRAILRQDLLSRLSEKLGRVSYRLEGINRLLKRHKFTGQTYAFTYAVDGRFARMHDLAMKSANGELTDDIFDSSMDEVEAMIEGAEEAAGLADYRRYFTFEIVMTDARGSRTTLSSRAMKGSGGEAQVPFYVAIAASLALAYFPGHLAGRPVGMGLALFDEAFNKLDVPNTQALLRFFRDMGLQLLIAGPEDKRATFTEVLDTIVLVNKALDGRSVYIDTEHPGEAARDALSQLNPDHRGIEGFRSAAE